MPGKKTGTIAAAGVVAAGAIAAIVGLSGEEKGDRDVSESVQSAKVFEREVCTRAVRSSTGRLVRVTGVQESSNAVVQDTAIGRAVVVESAGDNAVCHIMLDAPVKKKEEKDGVACPGDYADVPGLFSSFGKVSCPVMIPGSEKEKHYYWSVILKGGACELAGNLQSFKGSDMHDFLALPLPEKRRFLRVQGQCPVDGGFINCTVPVGDPRAVPDTPVGVPHGWAGRRDLNYVKAKKGKPELRYDIPDGGFEEAEIVEIQ